MLGLLGIKKANAVGADERANRVAYIRFTALEKDGQLADGQRRDGAEGHDEVGEDCGPETPTLARGSSNPLQLRPDPFKLTVRWFQTLSQR
jgi:hypothetical protein